MKKASSRSHPPISAFNAWCVIINLVCKRALPSVETQIYRVSNVNLPRDIRRLRQLPRFRRDKSSSLRGNPQLRTKRFSLQPLTFPLPLCPTPSTCAAKKLGPAPRTFNRAQNKILLAKAPDWHKSDPLKRVVSDRPLLLERGRIAAGVLIQANAYLWEPGQGDSAALALWSDDTRLETDLVKLRELALELADLKGKTPDKDKEAADKIAPMMAPFARDITNESARPLNLKLPDSWGLQGANFYLSALLVWRAHLPTRYLTGRVVPMLVLPEQTDATMILPAMFWCDELKDR